MRKTTTKEVWGVCPCTGTCMTCMICKGTGRYLSEVVTIIEESTSGEEKREEKVVEAEVIIPELEDKHENM